MEDIFGYICHWAPHAHWIIFCLFLLAGFSLPISEDILLITAGALASTCIPDHTLRLYLWCYFGAWISASQVYWIGRLVGPKLYKIRWFQRVVTPKRVDRLRYYYEKFGVFCFIAGRFIPGGVRNALFLSSGLCKMDYRKFLLRDGFACILSSLTLFYLGYIFGQNHHILIGYVKTYSEIVFFTVITILVSLTIFFWYRNINNRRKRTGD
jgi:membrane-associated protein